MSCCVFDLRNAFDDKVLSFIKCLFHPIADLFRENPLATTRDLEFTTSPAEKMTETAEEIEGTPSAAIPEIFSGVTGDCPSVTGKEEVTISLRRAFPDPGSP